MKKLISTLVILLLFVLNSLGQEITIFYSESKGEVVEMIVRHGEVAFLLDAEGYIKRIHIGHPATLGMHRSHRLGHSQIYRHDQDGVIFTLAQLEEKSHFDFYYKSRRNGKVSKLNGYEIDYYDYHYSTLKNGKLKNVGSVEIDYWDPHYQTLKKGKVQSIGDLEFDWHEPHYSSSFKGKIAEIGDIEIEYYNRSHLAHNGKIESIGDIEFEYIERARNESLEGKFKSFSGSDDRFRLKIVP